jgi:circadian clock protein KaiC
LSGGEPGSTPVDPTTTFPTGVPNLDRVLGGGLRRGAVVMVVGPPGAGKTILAQQVAFAAARRDEAVLYLTGYSETHEKLIGYNRSLAFFDPAFVPSRVQFVSLADLLARGPVETEEAIVATARGHRARLIVLDGFGSMRRLLPDEDSAAAFVYSLGAKLAYLGGTMLVVLEADPDATSGFGELTVSDAVLALRRERLGTRHRRVLEVLKVRGAAPLGGLHPFSLGQSGMHVHPRLESLPTAPDAPWRAGRAPFGAHDLDPLLAGGPNVATTTLAVGDLGTGKTTLGLHFLIAGASTGEPGLYLGFRESGPQLQEQARVFGLDLAGAEAAGQVRLLVLSGHELEPDQVAELVIADVEARGVRRLVVDAVNELRRSLVPSERQPEFFAALMTQLRARGVTTYLTLDVPRLLGDGALGDAQVAILAENLLWLRYAEHQGTVRRLLSVVKMHFSAHDRAIHEFTIEPGRGLAVIGRAPVGLAGGPMRPTDEDPPERPAGRRPRG